MRAAAIFGLGSSPSELRPFREGSPTEWSEGVPASASGADAVLIFGGDGTIHRHLPALERLGLPILTVPVGSGNDFARALGLRSIRDAVRVWRTFEAGEIRARAIDLGVIRPRGEPERGRYFCCVAGCGLDSATAELANKMPRWLRGHGGYVAALLPTLLRFPPFLLTVKTVNGAEHTENSRLTLLAAFANTPYYGDGMRIAPDADPADGKLDVCRIAALSPVKLFCMFPTVYFGGHRSMHEVEYSQAEHVCLETDRPLPVYADGEFVCETPVEIGVKSGGLLVIAPRNSG
ncbi:MAG TPA: diacylglycerol kinase family protein [Terriglobales bacterium]|nr:diacylglycerol kinase family protein [Terriglobales bacterium]